MAKIKTARCVGQCLGSLADFSNADALLKDCFTNFLGNRLPSWRD